MDDEQRWAEIERIKQAIRDHPCFSLDRDVRQIIRYRMIFLGNASDLEVALAIVDRPEEWLPLTSVQNRAEHSKYLDSLDRILHNYLAAAFSLSSVMHETAKAGLGSHFAEYEKTVPYRRAGPAALVFGLRHAIQHRALPVVLSHMEARQVAPGQWDTFEGFILPLEGLRALEWRDHPARDYVEALETDVDLRATVQQFTATMSGFVDLLVSRFRDLNAAALQDYDALHLKLSTVSAPSAEAYLKVISKDTN